jgi:Holliday junction resolvase RusA-like endonuclease
MDGGGLLKSKGLIDLPPGTKVLGINLAALEPAEAAPVAVEFAVTGVRPVPWKAPMVTKRGTYKSKKVRDWQSTISRQARLAMGSRMPMSGPVALTFCFHLGPRDGTPPDLSNLVKAAEDAIQGVVILNDRQVQRIISERIFRPADGMTVRVEEIPSP